MAMHSCIYYRYDLLHDLSYVEWLRQYHPEYMCDDNSFDFLCGTSDPYEPFEAPAPDCGPTDYTVCPPSPRVSITSIVSSSPTTSGNQCHSLP